MSNELMSTEEHRMLRTARLAGFDLSLGELGAIIRHLAQVCDQLASWHNRVEDGKHYEGEDGGTEGSASAAAAELTASVNALNLAANHVHRAHSHNAVVRWFDDLEED